MTAKIDGCPTDNQLCDVSLLVNRVSKFASRQRGDCNDDITNETDGGSTVLWQLARSTKLLLAIAAVVSFVAGSAIAHYLVMGATRRRYDSFEAIHKPATEVTRLNRSINQRQK
jgi:hypothetical protein